MVNHDNFFSLLHLPILTLHNPEKKKEKKYIGSKPIAQIYKKPHTGPCIKMWGVRAPKSDPMDKADRHKEHSCIQHLFTLYCDFSQTAP